MKRIRFAMCLSVPECGRVCALPPRIRPPARHRPATSVATAHQLTFSSIDIMTTSRSNSMCATTPRNRSRSKSTPDNTTRVQRSHIAEREARERDREDAVQEAINESVRAAKRIKRDTKIVEMITNITDLEGYAVSITNHEGMCSVDILSPSVVLSNGLQSITISRPSLGHALSAAWKEVTASRFTPPESFEIGMRVKFDTCAHKVRTHRDGLIKAEVPIGVNPWDAYEDRFKATYSQKTRARGHVSYIVECQETGIKYFPRLTAMEVAPPKVDDGGAWWEVDGE